MAFAQNDYQNAVVMDGSLYMLSDGKVYASTDAENWTAQGRDASLQQLIGASSKYLYAYTEAGISVSKDQGATWTAQTLDKDQAYLPTQNLSLSAATIRSTKNAEHLMLMGTRDELWTIPSPPSGLIPPTWMLPPTMSGTTLSWIRINLQDAKTG